MLVNCKKGCILNGGTTSAKLNVEENSVECDFCEETLDHISDYLKETMRSLGDIKRNKVITAFTFLCKGCNKNVETQVEGSTPVGKACQDRDSCSIDIPDSMIQAIKSLGAKNEQ